MASDFTQPRETSSPWGLSAHALSNTRLALVACTLLATVAVLLVVTIQARDAQDALDEAAAHTMRDYSGYSARMLGADLLRRFSEQRDDILASVQGRSGFDVTPPALEDIAALGNEKMRELGPEVAGDSALGFFKVDIATGKLEGIGAVRDFLGERVADTVRKLAPTLPPGFGPNIIGPRWDDGAYSVAYAPLFDSHGKVKAVYGYTYSRRVVVSAIAARVFREVPLLPVSYAGVRWNYDTTKVQAGEVANDRFVSVRVRDRRGRLLWETRDAAALMGNSPYGASTVLSTNAGGIVVDAAIHQSAEPQLVPVIVRKAQRWTLRGLIALALLLVMVSLIALRGERLGAKERRVEAMQQLALGLRHEINNALASVLLNAELMLHEEKSLSADQRERLDAIVEQADRMRKVVRRLERSEKLDVLVPYMNEGLMVDLSVPKDREHVV